MALLIAVLNQKGGAGKTTLATNIASGIHAQGDKVLLIDSDPQGSARDWKAAGTSEVPTIGMDKAGLFKDLQELSAPYDVVVIDGAPQVKDMAAAAVRVADLVLIPVQPSPYDIWATADLVGLIKARQEVTEGMPRAAFVVSRAIKNTKLSNEVAEALNGYELPVLASTTTQRVSYPSTAAEGGSVFNSKDAQAIAEINAIIQEITDLFTLREVTHVAC